MSESLDQSILYARCLGAYQGTLNFVFSQHCSMSPQEKLELIAQRHAEIADQINEHHA